MFSRQSHFTIAQSRKFLQVFLLFILGLGCPAVVQAININISQPSENAQVSAGQSITVTVSVSGSVAGIKSLACEQEGDDIETFNFNMSPPTLSTTKNFTYHIPFYATGGQVLTITATVQDWVDDPISETRHVVVKSTGPTPTPTPTMATYDSVSIGGDVYQAVHDPRRGCLYVPNLTAKRVEIIDVRARTIAGNIPLTSAPEGIDISSDSDRLFVGTSDQKIQVVDLNTRQITQSINLSAYGSPGDVPNSIAAGSNKAWIGLSDGQWGEVIKMNLDDYSTTRVGSSWGFYSPRLVASADDQYVIITETGISSSEVYVYNANTADFISSKSISSSGAVISANADGSRFLWNNKLFDRSLAPLGTITMGTGYGYFGIFLPNRDIVAAFSGSISHEYEEIMFYNVPTDATLKTISGIRPIISWEDYNMAVSSDGSILFLLGEKRVVFVPTGYGIPQAAADPASWALYQ